MDCRYTFSIWAYFYAFSDGVVGISTTFFLNGLSLYMNFFLPFPRFLLIFGRLELPETVEAVVAVSLLFLLYRSDYTRRIWWLILGAVIIRNAHGGAPWDGGGGGGCCSRIHYMLCCWWLLIFGVCDGYLGRSIVIYVHGGVFWQALVPWRSICT